MRPYGTAAPAGGPPTPLPNPLPPLPALTSPDVAHFVNLTNGIEALPLLRALNVPFAFCRVSSTACEQQRYDALLAGLDANLLAAAALGRTVLVWDFG